ncbi:hypothetical protein R8Z50_17680 [Longispora sp. K20-0274]|uniref:hypothetical protein n=1 Tax=Longispora sp. K20-0274 TaxID=3088255 RepID=UPI00399BB30B
MTRRRATSISEARTARARRGRGVRRCQPSRRTSSSATVQYWRPSAAYLLRMTLRQS